MKRKWILGALLLALLMLAGCSMRTVDQMYCLPKRSVDDQKLQIAIDAAMNGLEYCAPLSGEHQQSVQMADLDGDTYPEYLVFAKGTSDRPLRILIFKEKAEEFVLTDTIESTGTAFDQVEYVQMDGVGSIEIVVGCQLSDKMLRSVSVYSNNGEDFSQILSVNYTKFLMADLNSDSYNELFVLRPGQAETDNGIAELYRMEDGSIERYNEVSMSGPADKLKRIVVGKLMGQFPAVYAASAVGDNALITDVYTVYEEKLANISFSNESGTSVNTLRNYYVYADDIDNDGVVELPDVSSLVSTQKEDGEQSYELIRWYAMTLAGEEVDKLYTYHNFVGGWYLELGNEWASLLSVTRQGSTDELFLWDKSYKHSQKILTIHAISAKNREELARDGNYTILLKTDSIIYAATLEDAGREIGLDEETLIRSFHLIQRDWKTGEI